jgi:hypothetical protein
MTNRRDFKILRLLRRHLINFFAHFFGKGADLGKLFMQIFKVMYT